VAINLKIPYALVLACLFLGTHVIDACAQPKSAQPKSAGGQDTRSEVGTVEFSRQEAAELLATLVKDVPEISTPGIPGPLCVYGPRAIPVIVDTKGPHQMPLVAVAEFGRGRLVAFAHDGYFSNLLEQHAATGQLMLNLVRWSAGSADGGGPIKVGVRGHDAVQKFLGPHQIEVVRLSGSDWTTKLGDCATVVTHLEDCSAEQLDQVEHYIREGGAVISTALVWGWLQSHAGADPRVDHPANRLFAKAGIVWADGYAASHSGAKVAARAEPAEFAHVRWALAALDKASQNERALDPGDFLAIDAELASAYAAIPRDHDACALARLDSFVSKYGSKISIPSSKTPVTTKHPDERLIVSLQTRYFERLPVAELKPHPAAATFPGSVKKGTTTKSQAVELSLDQVGWKSTGLYAAPGDKVVVETDQKDFRPGLSLQIGAHSDGLWHVDSWKRVPHVVRRFAWDQPRVEVGSAMGGLIYVDVPEKAAGGKLSITISNAVPAPYFRHLHDTDEKWSSELRNRPAPWAELECSKIIFTVPSNLIRDVDEPTALMEHWVKVVDACADLAAIPHERKTPQRLVFDVQISAGFLHSGYPIMGHIDPTAPEAVSLRHMQTQGGWGFYHELGHNHQQADWTFDGTVEVTCNLFSLYVLETLTPQAYTHSAMQPAERDNREKKYIEQGANFEKWKADPFLALTMYQQLQTGFGWQPFKDVFAEYRDLKQQERPKSQEDKRDQWMVRFSRRVGRNLGPFFQYWGVPTSDAARNSISTLPTWMPEGRPLAR